MPRASTAHRRYNPLLDEWVLCSPDRLERPWQGHMEAPPATPLPPHDPDCYLCPGGRRASGAMNPQYSSTFTFDNDFPALAPNSDGLSRDDGLFRAMPENGMCRVLCFTPRHDVTLARMPRSDVRVVVDAWADESAALSATDGIGYVQLFENKGRMMGCSNPHPHAQLWATGHVPTIPARKRDAQRKYLAQHVTDLLGDYARAEVADGARVVWHDEHWTVVVPFWAVWPYQTMLIPSRRVTTLSQLSDSERDSLTAAVLQITRRYDALFATDTPYSMIWSPAPTDAVSSDEGSWRLHAEFLPPLLRSASVRKFLVGYELGAEPQRDLTPETAAERLRAQSIDPP
jgi:UDPglucose--hexose-1-phosphate uridylyltransferase